MFHVMYRVDQPGTQEWLPVGFIADSANDLLLKTHSLETKEEADRALALVRAWERRNGGSTEYRIHTDDGKVYHGWGTSSVGWKMSPLPEPTSNEKE